MAKNVSSEENKESEESNLICLCQIGILIIRPFLARNTAFLMSNIGAQLNKYRFDNMIDEISSNILANSYVHDWQYSLSGEGLL